MYMRTLQVIASVVVLMFVAIAPAQQTSEQKRLMDRHKNVMLNAPGDQERPKVKYKHTFADLGDSIEYLLSRKSSVTFVEDQLISYRQEKKMMAWDITFGRYFGRFTLEDCPDRLLPEVYYAFRSKRNFFGPKAIVELGARANPLIPDLEAIRDNPKSSDNQIKEATDAILRIRNP